MKWLLDHPKTFMAILFTFSFILAYFILSHVFK